MVLSSPASEATDFKTQRSNGRGCMTPGERTETKKSVCCNFSSITTIRVTFSVSRYSNCFIILSAIVKSRLMVVLQFTELEKDTPSYAHSAGHQGSLAATPKGQEEAGEQMTTYIQRALEALVPLPSLLCTGSVCRPFTFPLSRAGNVQA